MSNTTEPRSGFARHHRRVKQVTWRAVLGAAYAVGGLVVTMGLPWLASRI